VPSGSDAPEDSRKKGRGGCRGPWGVARGDCDEELDDDEGIASGAGGDEGKGAWELGTRPGQWAFKVPRTLATS